MATDGRRAALVAGGSGGLGAAVCRALAAGTAGAAVYVGFRQGAERAAQVAGAIREAGGRAEPVPLDLLDPAAPEAVCRLIFEREGTPCYTVPARGRPLVREVYFLLREAVAFPFYYLYYR